MCRHCIARVAVGGASCNDLIANVSAAIHVHYYRIAMEAPFVVVGNYSNLKTCLHCARLMSCNKTLMMFSLFLLLYCRYLYFLQLKHSVITGELKCSNEMAIKLASFALQGTCTL